MKEFYTIKEITELLQISKMTVYRYIKSGKLKAFKPGRDLRIKKSDFESFIQESRFHIT